MPINTLVLDDEATWRDLITEVLEEEGHIVQAVETLAEARECLAKQRFHLAVLDVVLSKDEDGLDLLNTLSALSGEADRFCGPVVLTGYPTQENAIKALKGGATAFHVKPEEAIVRKLGSEAKSLIEQELLDASRRVVKQVLLQGNRLYEDSTYTLCFDLAPGEKPRAELIGPTTLVMNSKHVLELDIDSFAGRADDLQFHFSASDEDARLKWRPRARDIGSDLYERLFTKDVTLAKCLVDAKAHSADQPLHIGFRGSQDLLRLPLELLYGETGYWAIEKPLARQISGVMNTAKGIDRVFLNKEPELKILLIGSNTKPAIPGVDEEIEQLRTDIPKLCTSRGFNCTVHSIPTKDATWDTAYAHLSKCQYHIVHYAGHGSHHETNSDESGISFWEKPNRSGKVKPMPIHTLRNLLQYSNTRFFYLSCCVGAKGAAPAIVKLNGNDFQGIVEGLVKVGIPGVLGYRWNVWDTEAKELALAFYEGLLTDLRLDLALSKARRALQETKYYNETWASPVLVTQAI